MQISVLRRIYDLVNLFKIEDQLEMFVGIAAAVVIANNSIFFPNLCGFLLVSLFGFLNISAAIILNQYTDAEADKINKPYRAIPAGKIKPKNMLFFAILLYAIGISIALYLGLVYLLLSMVSISVGVSYSYRCFHVRDNILLSILLLAFGYVIWAFIVGWAIYQPISAIPWWFIGILLMADSAEAIVKDYRDIVGDKHGGINTLPLRVGYQKAAKLNFVFYSMPFFLLIFGFLFGILNIKFALMGIYCLITSVIAFYGLIKRQRYTDALLAYRIVTSNYFITRLGGAWAFLP